MRQRSQANRNKTTVDMDIVTSVMIDHMRRLDLSILIHGHIHKPGLTTHKYEGNNYLQYVLSDWDDKPNLLCYDRAKGFYFVRLVGG